MHLLAKVRLQVPVLVAQQSPDPFGLVPMGQVPSKVGVVHLLLALVRLQVKCSELTSRHILPPITVADADANRRVIETCAFVPQLVPMRQDEKATPVAEAQETLVPRAPVRFSVFWSFDPM